MVSEARVAAEDLQGRHKRRKNKEERMKSVLEGRHPFVSVDPGITTACMGMRALIPSFSMSATEQIYIWVSC